MQLYLPLFLSFIEIASSICTHNNCVRALMGVDQILASNDCSSFLETTITPPASTVSVTFTTAVIATTTLHAKRQAYATIPDYASGKCEDVVAYASGCSCLGVTHAIITAPVPVTTITVTAFTTDIVTITIPKSTPTHSVTSYTNSSSTSLTSPTISSSPTQCQGQTCGGFTNCSGNSTCFCFTSTRNGTSNGFCGQNAVCGGLTPCANDFDCLSRNSTGDTCAIQTCCGAPSVALPGVCLKGICGNPAANLKMASLARRWIGGTAAGFRHGF